MPSRSVSPLVDKNQKFFVQNIDGTFYCEDCGGDVGDLVCHKAFGCNPLMKENNLLFKENRVKLSTYC